MKKTLFVVLLLSPILLIAQPKIKLNNFASGFDLPVDIANCGDSRIFVVERDGVIWVLDSIGNRLDTFLNIDPRVNSAQNEQGLLGLAFHPNYAQNGYFFVNYTKNNGGATRVARFSVKPGNPNEADPNSELMILEQTQPNWNHNGGSLKFGPDGYLYTGIGDGGGANDPQNYAQNKKTFLGKILRIDVNNSSPGTPYVVPPDNPFVGNADYFPEIWSLGWRNPWRFSFDRLTGDMWIGDVGQNLWEEIDFEPANTPGLNYGWRCYEGTHNFNTTGCQPYSAYAPPVFEYSHSGGNGCSVTGGFIYRGSKFPDLYGCYLFADFCSGRWWYTKQNANGTFSTAVLANLGGYEFSSFGEDHSGELLVALLSTGRVQRVVELCSPFQVSGMASPGICTGTLSGDITLATTGATGTVSYVWSNGATSQNISGLGSGTYFVEARDGNNCIRRDTFEIVEVGPETPSLSASELEICSNGLVTLTAGNLKASSALNWYNGADIVATTIASASTATLEVTAPGDYTVLVDDPLCPASSSIITIVKVGPDIPILSTSNSEICANGSATLTASNLPVPSTLTWYNGANIVATTNVSAPTATLDITQAGNYSVIINDPVCLVSSGIVSIVTIGPENPTLSASALEFCPNGSVQLTAGNLPVPSMLTWYNGANVVATTNATASTATIDILQAGDYTVIVNDAFCPASSSIVSVGMIEPYNPALSASDLEICANGSAILTASNLPVPSTLSWYNGSNIVATTNASDSTATLVISQPGDYTVVVNHPLCLFSSSIVSIARIGPDIPMLNATASVICPNDSILLTASNLPVPSTIIWYNGANIIATTNVLTSTATLDITQSGDYSVHIYDPVCPVTSSIVSVVLIGSEHPMLAASDSVICVNGSVQLIASNLPVPSTLSWYNGANIVATTVATSSSSTLEITLPGAYTVAVNDALCLMPSSVLSIVRIGPDNPILTASDTVICLIGSVDLIASGLPVPSTLTWFNGANIIATTNATDSVAVIEITAPGDYSVIINDATCLAQSSIVRVVRIGPDDPILTASNTILCANGSVQLIAGNLPVPATLTWYNGANVVATTNTTDSIATFEITLPGNYSVVINDPVCLNSSQVVSVLADTPLDILIATDLDSLYALSPCSACQWLFQGQAIPGATGMYHIAMNEGYYSLQDTSANGCLYVSNEVFITKVSNKLPVSVRRFSLSPNPTDHSVVLEMEMEKSERFSISLTDSSQRLVFSKSLDSQTIVLPIDLSNLPLGTYFMTVRTESGQFVRKVVKK